MKPLLWTSNKYYVFWVCVCSLSFAACKAHTLYCVIYGLSGNTVFFHVITHTARFSYKYYGTWNTCLILFATFVWNTVHYTEKTEWDIVINIHVKYWLFLLALNENWIFLNVKFGENPSTGSRAVPCGQTDGETDRQTYVGKVILAFRKSANAHKNCLWVCVESIIDGSDRDI